MNVIAFILVVLDEDKRLAKRKLIEQNRELRRHKELSQMMAQCGWRIERPTDDERRLIHDVTQAYFQANDIQNVTTIYIKTCCFVATSNMIFILQVLTFFYHKMTNVSLSLIYLKSLRDLYIYTQVSRLVLKCAIYICEYVVYPIASLLYIEEG